MARHLEAWQHERMRHMIRTKRFGAVQIADAAKCSKRTVKYIPTYVYLVAKARHSIVEVDHEVLLHLCSKLFSITSRKSWSISQGNVSISV